MPEAEPTEVDRAIAEHAVRFIPDGATLQTGIGAIPSAIARLLADTPGGGYGVHSEMFTDGLMRLHEAGKVVNQKGLFDGVSVATFAFGSQPLYDWLHGNHDVAFLPGRGGQLPGGDRPQPADVHDQRRAGRRHPRPGRRRHDRRDAVLRRRRGGGLHLRARASRSPSGR